MKTTFFFAVVALCFQIHAQLPYFQQDHSGNNLSYGSPVDIDFNGASTVYSLHTAKPGMVAVKYNAATGSLIDVSYIARGSVTITPVRVRSLGSNYYVLFNVTISGVSHFCLASFNVTTNAVNWSQVYNPPAGALPRTGADFVLDGGAYAYILSNAYDDVATQGDIAVTKVDITTATPTLIWDNVYQNLTRSESGFNIAYRGEDEIAISGISYDIDNPLADRGPLVMRIEAPGYYLSSMLYKYSSSCSSVRPSGAWVVIAGSSFYLSSVSQVGADGNGPLWLANINPVTLGINVQSNYSSGTAYLYPEIQPILTTASGGEGMISGAAPSVNTATPGYVHLMFNGATLAFTQGVLYPTTNPAAYGSPMYDAYISTGTGMNIFSVAKNEAVANGYHLLKTSDVGDNACEIPYSVDPVSCSMDPYAISFAQVPVATTSGPATLTVAARSNSFVQSCLVPCTVCVHRAENESSEKSLSLADPEIYSFPNPTIGEVNLTADGASISEVSVCTVTGSEVRANIRPTAEGIEIDLSGNKAGIYIVQFRLDGERKTVRVVLE